MPSFPTAMPAPRTPNAMDAPPLRWGILGTGWIAERFVDTVQRHTRQRFTAVGSRDAARAAQFAERHGIPCSYGSYEELVADDDVDVVYIATGHQAHLPCARWALEAGKHILVEKPLALDAKEGELIAGLARDQGLFCAEALWTFFLPRFDVVRQIVESGVLGEIHTVLAEHGEHFSVGHRILRPDLAGGPLLDLGTYPLALATWLLGTPTGVAAAGQPHPAGVHGQLAVTLWDGAGAQAVVHTTVFSDTPTVAVVAGSRATLSLPGPFYQPGDVVLAPFDGAAPLTYSEPPVAHEALYFEAAEVARCVEAGLVQTPLRPLDDSVVTLRLMDEIRRQCAITSTELDSSGDTG